LHRQQPEKDKEKENVDVAPMEKIPLTPMVSQGRNEGGKRGTLSRAPNHYGCAEWLRGRPKSPNNVTSTSSMQYICFQKTSISNMGAPNVLLATGTI